MVYVAAVVYIAGWAEKACATIVAKERCDPLDVSMTCAAVYPFVARGWAQGCWRLSCRMRLGDGCQSGAAV
jgi:hypothetical protein